MEWLNLHTSVLDSPEVIGEDPINRATWLFLLRYSIGQENGGRIESAQSWGDRKWQQLIRVTKKEIMRASALWKWEGDALVVFAYPIDRELIVKNKRAIARVNGLTGGRPKTNPTDEQTKPISKPTLDNSGKAEGEREREEEGERESQSSGGLFTLTNSPQDLPPPPKPKSELIAEIYLAYPRRVARANAEKAISKALGAKSHAELLAATQAYAEAVKTWPEADRRFVPHPATWFNRGSYDDDPATWKRGKDDSEVAKTLNYSY